MKAPCEENQLIVYCVQIVTTSSLQWSVMTNFIRTDVPLAHINIKIKFAPH